MGVCNCSMFCCTLLYVHSSIVIILMGKRELIALLNLSSWCLMTALAALPRGATGGCMQFVIMVFPDHTHLLFFLCRGPYTKTPNSHGILILTVTHYSFSILHMQISELKARNHSQNLNFNFPLLT